MDVVLLSRIQFGLNVAFHYLYPPLSIGLGLMLVIMEGMYIKTKKACYRDMTKFWVKIFALTFALGVATGIVQVFGFGNNWARYSRYVGDVFGSALAAEGIFAFFLEAGFIGLMLFGWERVSAKVHYFSTICTALGAHFSAIWIIVANSWMQTPAGYAIEGEGAEAHAVMTNFWEMVFNPSFLDRLTHVIIGAWLTGAFMVISVCAYYFLKKRHTEFAYRGMKLGLVMASILVILQFISADSTARGVAKNQPEKLAAIEGVYKTQPHTAMNLIGYVDSKTQEVHALQVPGLLSFLTYRNFETPVPGLDQFPEEDWPPVSSVFQFYHMMIYAWGAMFLATVLGLILWKRKTFEKSKWINRFLVLSILFPYVGNQAGWFTAEMGRQPWIVYHLLRTTQGVSKSIHAGQVFGSITMFVCIYILLFSLFCFLLNRKIKHGPIEEPANEPDDIIYRDPYQSPT
ncbi:MAG: cytochrome ubiquinol oxidase subunit I [Simkania sp.]|nr:cytochrome ubiquinol oxidase subunit I [Simkania sp.]MCB1074759.1 cytochrome ubiquinol oxidase subunit I [Simkania sp.]MCP5490175.1 cytochrome ubiquinol oxidase subunit I [Chlamydiales bacterium]